MNVTFQKNHDRRLKPSVVVAYKKGSTADLPASEAKSLIKEGIAVAAPSGTKKDKSNG